MSQGCPPELKRLYREKRVLPFVGAGASMALTWDEAGKLTSGPSWSQMVDEACRQLGYSDPDLLRMRGTDLQILEYFAIKKGNFAYLTNWMVKKLNATDADIKKSVLHSALSALQNCSVYYTTNYDDFLERSIIHAGRDAKPIISERDMGYGGPIVEVVKFHGDFNFPEKMVVSEGHYFSRMGLSDALDFKLRSDLLGRAVLFVGYSFRDMNIAYIFDGLNALFKALPESATGKRAYIIAHNPSEFERSLFHKRNIEVIPTYGDDRTAATAEILQELIS